MMLHLDGSKHRWLPGSGYQDLILMFDDADSEVYYAQLVAEESTNTVMAAIREVVGQQGVFNSLYTDAASHFVHTPVAGYPPDREHRTQVARALERLEIELIVAHSPQARGRCEGMFGTWQGRLPQELRLRGIRTLKEPNRYLREGWIGFHNRRFTVPPAPAGTAFVPADGIDLEQIFSHQENRVAGADNTVRYRRRILQIEPQRFRHTLAKCRVWVCEHLDGNLSLYYGLHRLGHYDRQGRLLHEEVA